MVGIDGLGLAGASRRATGARCTGSGCASGSTPHSPALRTTRSPAAVVNGVAVPRRPPCCPDRTAPPSLGPDGPLHRTVAMADRALRIPGDRVGRMSGHPKGPILLRPRLRYHHGHPERRRSRPDRERDDPPPALSLRRLHPDRRQRPGLDDLDRQRVPRQTLRRRRAGRLPRQHLRLERRTRRRALGRARGGHRLAVLQLGAASLVGSGSPHPRRTTPVRGVLRFRSAAVGTTGAHGVDSVGGFSFSSKNARTRSTPTCCRCSVSVACLRPANSIAMKLSPSSRRKVSKRVPTAGSSS